MPQGWCDANLDSFCAHRRQRCAGRDEETDSEIHSEGTRCATLANSLTKKAPYKGRSADSEEKREPVSDIDTAVVDGLKALDPNRPIREATEVRCRKASLCATSGHSITSSARASTLSGTSKPSAL